VTDSGEVSLQFGVPPVRVKGEMGEELWLSREERNDVTVATAGEETSCSIPGRLLRDGS